MATLVALVLCAPAAAADEGFRLRIAWGGGAERLWHGRIAVSPGTLASPTPLGMEADEPGSMWLEHGELAIERVRGEKSPRPAVASGAHLAIRQRSPRNYDAADVLAVAPPDAILYVDLRGDDRQPPQWIALRLADVLQAGCSVALDESGNRLVVRGSPGDQLRVRLPRASLVFGPGEVFRTEVEPRLLDGDPSGRVKLKATVLHARSSREITSREYVLAAGQTGPLSVDVPLPREEGVYDVLLSAGRGARFQWLHGAHKGGEVERTVQVIVLDDRGPAPPRAEGRLAPVVEIDPANAKWWSKFSLQNLPRLSKSELGNGELGAWQHPAGRLSQLPPSGQTSDLAWRAYTLPISHPGRPHIVEVEYPANVPQTLAVSIVEPNAAGAVLPIGVDSGVEVNDEPGAAPRAELAVHRVVCWPRTKAPVLLIANRRDGQPAVYGKIRVLAGWSRLPPLLAPGGPRPERLLAAYMDRPLLTQNFSASQAVGGGGEMALDDWVTFLEGGSRLVEYLRYAGHGGLMLAVAADGSALYPSELLEPTPRYDTGTLLATGQDPVRKDVLEMLLRLFDREDLQLIPAVEFAAPLPELEALLRRDPDGDGIRWIGPDGASYPQRHAAARGKMPYYNVLDPRVQEAMLRVLQELVARCGQHPSLGGVAIQLSAYGYAQLPGPEWGLDDRTIAAFQRDTGIRVPGEGDERFAQRAAFLTQQRRPEWLQWRAGQLARFYRRAYAQLNAARPGCRLYLAGAQLFNDEDLQRQLQPALPRRLGISEALLRVGIDVRHYNDFDGVVLLRPERVVPRVSLAAQAQGVEVQQLPELDRCFEAAGYPASLFFHPPLEARLASFDQQGPFRPSYAWLASQVVPSAWQNRRRFVHSLAATDAQAIFDGGWLLPMGQEDSLRELVAVYRQLPAIRMERLGDQEGFASGQPVTIRCGSREGRTYMLAVNDAPFPVSLRLRVEAPPGCRADELGLRRFGPLRRDDEGYFWEASLAPYDLAGVAFSAPGVRLTRPRVSWSPEVNAAMERLISQMGDRVAGLRNPPIWPGLSNPGFERPAGAGAAIPGWTAVAPQGASVQLDASVRFEGTHAVRVRSDGAAASLVSRPFSPPPTGRLAMCARLRTGDAARPPQVRLAVEGKHHGRDFYRYAQAAPASDGWVPFVIQVNDLPLDGLSPLQVRFDLLSAGDLWIDDVQLRALDFTKEERVELLRQVAPADVKLQNGEIGDCVRLLDGYWPQFLARHVPAPEVAVSQRPEAAGRSEPARANGLFGRVREAIPEKLRF